MCEDRGPYAYLYIVILFVLGSLQNQPKKGTVEKEKQKQKKHAEAIWKHPRNSSRRPKQAMIEHTRQAALCKHDEREAMHLQH